MCIGGRHLDRHPPVHRARARSGDPDPWAVPRHRRLLLRGLQGREVHLQVPGGPRHRLHLHTGRNLVPLPDVRWRPERDPGRVQPMPRYISRTKYEGAKMGGGVHKGVAASITCQVKDNLLHTKIQRVLLTFQTFKFKSKGSNGKVAYNVIYGRGLEVLTA